MTEPVSNTPKGSHDPAECNDQAQLNALFADAHCLKPAAPQPRAPQIPVVGTEEELRIMRLNFWDI